MRNFALASLLVATAWLSGCATTVQLPIDLAPGYYSNQTNRIGVVLSEIPKPDTVFPGANCLLCSMVASGAHSSLTEAVRAWPMTDLAALRGELRVMLAASGQKVVEIEQPLVIRDLNDRSDPQPGFARKDFSAFRAKGFDRLLVVNVQRVGVSRNYSVYVPTASPQAVIDAESYIVDLSNHRLDTYRSFAFARGADGTWDEPPKFPGLTNAFFQVVEQVKDEVKRLLRQ